MTQSDQTAVDKDRPIVKLKLDVIFKRVFGDENNSDIIAAFISDLLELPRDSVKSVSIDNVEIAPEFYGRKFSRLDLKLKVDDKIVNVEIQIGDKSYFKERTLFYWSKLYSNGLKEGEEYKQLRRTICINIVNFNLFDSENYHSHFQALERTRHELLSDKFAIHFFELPKVGKFKMNQRIEEWLTLIKAETEGDLMELEQTSTVPEVGKTIVLLRRLSADEKVQQEAWYREKQLHDEASALRWSEVKTIARLVKKGLLTAEQGAEEASMTLPEFEDILESYSREF